ncbi:PilZ domain-containing protein [Marichromatium bheemlicum]|uniref:PilZ domain-containing protein n=1 Tax=Marichromatium bheemlicum TaxID=365339 RepID=A0ABX1I9J5_9GAMM|nr:PilZ domain-containing protein [Marichromatium bheemlicum]
MRLTADTEANVKRLNDSEMLSVRMIDLSPSGCALVCDAPFAPGDQLEVGISSPSERIAPLVCNGRVVRVDRNGDHHVVGIEFTADAS